MASYRNQYDRYLKDKRGRLSIAAPVITDFVVSGIDGSGATITWTTDVACSSQVRYGVYPFSSDSYTTLNASLATSHSVTLTGLDPSKNHRCQGLSRRVEGPKAESDVVMFTTTSIAPSDISGRLVHYDAGVQVYQDAGATTPADGNGETVALWKDQSGNARHLTQPLADASAQPAILVNAGTSNLPWVRFDGSNDYLTATCPLTNIPYTVVVVARYAAAPTSPVEGLLSSNDFPTNGLGFLYSGVIGAVSFIGTGDLYAPYSPDSQLHCWIGTLNGSSSKIHDNGTLKITGTVTNTNFTDFMLGALIVTGPAFFGHWDMAEVVVYSGALTNAQITGVTNYLATKWSISIT